MQLGPMTRNPVRATTSVIWFCRAMPSSPASANPAVMTAAPPTPRSAHSWRAPGTCRAGTATTARSTGSGRSRTDLYAATPCTVSSRGVTGVTGPSKARTRLAKTWPPMLATLLDAPIMTIDCGDKSRSMAERVLWSPGVGLPLVSLMVSPSVSFSGRERPGRRSSQAGAPPPIRPAVGMAASRGTSVSPIRTTSRRNSARLSTGCRTPP